jgi:Zn-dependent peptidase ImmA (M78 family)
MEVIAEKVEFLLKWTDACDGQDVHTVARLAVFADDIAVWPVWGDTTVELEIFCDDLLSHLTEFWQPLTLRQTYPLSLVVERPSQLRGGAEKLWGELPEAEVERQEDLVSAFEDAHDLARCFAGQFNLPPLWLLREGNYMLMETSDRVVRVKFPRFMDVLSHVGSEIANRLEQADGQQWAQLVNRWHCRDQGDPDMLLAWSTGLPRESATTLRKSGVLRSGSSVHEVANDNDELRIAARMTGDLPVHEIERILRAASRVPSRATSNLDELACGVRQVLTPEGRELLPFEQGVAAARRVREYLKIAPDKRLDLLPMLYTRYDIYVLFESLKLATLDALAIWGSEHGPGIIVNRDSRRLALTSRGEAASHGAARVTVAHELCHLLLDRDQALGAVDILNGRMPLRIEQRARAFAAALLVPSDASAQIWATSGARVTRDGVTDVLRRLTRRFGVTTSVAAWQLEHGLQGQYPDVIFLLDQIVPQRRFVG